MKRTSQAVWNGTGKEGNGKLTAQSGVLKEMNYSWHTRFEDAPGTNPEELIAAAHAGCYSMKLAFILTNAGFPPKTIETKATVTLESGSITESALQTTVTADNLTDEQFQPLAEEAKNTCPVSKALNMKLTLSASLSN